jgi:hypothetical protein
MKDCSQLHDSLPALTSVSSTNFQGFGPGGQKLFRRRKHAREQTNKHTIERSPDCSTLRSETAAARQSTRTRRLCLRMHSRFRSLLHFRCTMENTLTAELATKSQIVVANHEGGCLLPVAVAIIPLCYVEAPEKQVESFLPPSMVAYPQRPAATS